MYPVDGYYFLNVEKYIKTLSLSDNEDEVPVVKRIKMVIKTEYFQSLYTLLEIIIKKTFKLFTAL